MVNNRRDKFMAKRNISIFFEVSEVEQNIEVKV